MSAALVSEEAAKNALIPVSGLAGTRLKRLTLARKMHQRSSETLYGPMFNFT